MCVLQKDVLLSKKGFVFFLWSGRYVPLMFHQLNIATLNKSGTVADTHPRQWRIFKMLHCPMSWTREVRMANIFKSENRHLEEFFSIFHITKIFPGDNYLPAQMIPCVKQKPDPICTHRFFPCCPFFLPSVIALWMWGHFNPETSLFALQEKHLPPTRTLSNCSEFFYKKNAFLQFRHKLYLCYSVLCLSCSVFF